MGCVPTITFSGYPRQTEKVGKRVVVVFHYDTANQVGAKILRDDAEDPGRTIIQTDDGRFLLSTECQFMMVQC